MTEGKRRMGFACMDPAIRREIARKGGINAHKTGAAHEWTSAEASEAGRKGGKTSGGLQHRRAVERMRSRELEHVEPPESDEPAEGSAE